MTLRLFYCRTFFHGTISYKPTCLSSLLSSRALLLEGEPGGVPDPMLKIGESDRMGARQLGLEPREPRSTESMSADRNKIVLRLTFEAE